MTMQQPHVRNGVAETDPSAVLAARQGSGVQGCNGSSKRLPPVVCKVGTGSSGGTGMHAENRTGVLAARGPVVAGLGLAAGEGVVAGGIDAGALRPRRHVLERILEVDALFARMVARSSNY